ncbi:MAG: catalase-peroxidase, partial [Aeromicrobium sp.]
VNLTAMGQQWTASDDTDTMFECRDLATGDVRWTGSRADLVFGSNSELRALAEVYASDDAGDKFVTDFIAAWDKVMMLDRYDLV